MNILSVTTLFPNPAHPRFGIFIANRLNKLIQYHDVNIKVIAPVPWFPLASMIQKYAFLKQIPLSSSWQQLPVDYPRYLSIPGRGLGLKPRMIANSILSQIERNARFDLIDAHYAYPDGAAAAIVAKVLNLPMILSVRGSDINELPKNPAIKKSIQKTLRNTKHVISVSRPLAKKVEELCPGQQVSVIENGVDRTVFYMNNDEEKQSNLILSVGNLVSLKGHHLVISALTELPDLELVIIGSGPEQKRLEELIQQEKLTNRVKIIGNMSQTELARWYNKACCTVLASANEGCPNVVLESIACGTPVVATRVGACEDLIKDGVTGVFVEERSRAGVIAALRKYQDTCFERKEIENQSQVFGWRSVCERQFNVYQTVKNNTH